MTITGIILLMGGFLAGLLSCKYKITDYDSTINKIKSVYSWILARFTAPTEEKEKKDEQSKENNG
tara:strand:+ start:2342 stop:2536 length:195 start_codon:yes stop_codon:yes gene_type:complete